MNLRNLCQRRLALVLAALPALLLGASPVQGQVRTASNAFYRVHVQQSGNVGQYTITTGAEHPSGAGLNVLFGGGSPGTSFNTYRSFTTATDYTQEPVAGGRVLGSFGTVTPLGSTGFRTTYTLPGPPLTPDSLVIISDVRVNGTTFSNSSVEVSTTIQNTGTASVNMGIRYMWDVQVASDDGPTFQTIAPSGQVRVNATEYNAPEFVAFRIEDNDVNATVPTFNIFGTVTGPSSLIPVPTPPSRLLFSSWPQATGVSFDFPIEPLQVVAVAGAVNDSAVSYFFGHNEATSLLIPPGGSRKVSASLLLAPPGFSFGEDFALECRTSIPAPQPTHDGCITRPARFWMEHPIGDDPNCVSLVRAFQNNGEGVDLGFICLPTTFRNGDAEADAFDATVEALGLLYRNQRLTGDSGGRQDLKIRGSALCRERKRLAVEMVAATANVVLLGTDPGNCTFTDGGLTVSFATNLLEQAGAALASEDVNSIRVFTALVRKFNGLGQTNQFPGELVECLATPRRTLKQISRDPTTQLSCPGINDACQTAQSIFNLPFRASVDLSRYTDLIGAPGCDPGGADAVWRVSPPVAATGRNFLITTSGNFPTLASVWSGDSCSELVPLDCSTLTGVQGSTNYLQFTTNGSNTYYIVIEGQNGAAGKVKLNVTSF